MNVLKGLPRDAQHRSSARRTAGLRRAARWAVGVVGAIALSVGVALPANAAPSHTSTLPYSTGCASSKVLLHTYYIGGGAMRTYYSTACQTNWIEWSGPNVCTWKRIKTGTGAWTAWEIDQAPWSYSRQVYAPGTTQVDIEIGVSSTAFGNGTCGGGAWDYHHEIGQHRWYSMT